ncbi:MAG: dihydroorotase [Ruminococcaceae bacterium]|nr:dihydroorotase [Oscillospiraceae bacterium]
MSATKLKTQFHPVSVELSDGVLTRLSSLCPSEGTEYAVLPGFCDVHVHLRQPGFSYKETVYTGTRAAAAGGFTAICSMPNLNPVPDSEENIKLQQQIIDLDSVINTYPYASITVAQKGEKLSDMEALAPHCIAFSDDGKGIQSTEMMLSAMKKAKALGKMIVAHCEDESLLEGGYIHKGSYCQRHGHRGISSESEYAQIKRDIELLRETGVKYHVCHVSAAESIRAIREAKKEGLDITCETAPHYLILTDEDLKEDGRFKMNPPLRSAEDRDELIKGICDGTVDMIATDHAPHSAEEKSRGLEKSVFGIVGLETCFPLMYTHFVKTGIITTEKLVELMAINPRKRFGIPLSKEDLCVWDLNAQIKVDPQKFQSMGRATPFEGERLYGKAILTLCGGRTVHKA